jgi:uncharacterized protein (DUF1330 family)
MAAYLLAESQITDQATYDSYKRQVAPVIAKFGGQFIVRGGPIEVLEGTWQPSKLVIIEFPDMGTLKSWYTSAEYAPLLALRQSAATDHLIAVEGL